MVDFNAFEPVGNFNAVVTPVVDTRSLFEAVPGIDTCLLELAASLTAARNTGMNDSATRKFIVDALVTPFNEAGAAFNELFIPDTAALNAAEGTEGYVQEYTKQVVESFKNPISAILAAQKSTFQTGLDQVGDIVLGSGVPGNPGVAAVSDQIYDRVSFIFTELFMRGQEAGQNLAGLLTLAVTEAIPAIDQELRYIKRLRSALRASQEQASKLPPSMIPQLPGISASVDLCEAQQALKNVAQQLRNQHTWNRAEYGRATKAVISARDTMASGIIPASSYDMVKSLTGWDDRQMSALANGSFMPDVTFRLSTIEILSLNNFIQQADVHVITLHRNLQTTLGTLESLTAFHLGDALGLIIEVLRNQIATLQADIDAQSVGFTGALPAGIPDYVEVDKQRVQIISNPEQGVPQPGILRRNKKYATDVYAALSAQFASYVTLAGLAFIMERVQGMQNAIQSLLSQNSKFYKLLTDFTKFYTAGDCTAAGFGTGTYSAQLLDNRVRDYLQTLDDKLRGGTPTQAFIQARAREVLDAATAHEKFLTCMRDRLFMGNEQIIKAAVAATNAIKAAKNIKRLVTAFPEATEAVRNFDFEQMLGIGGKPSNALDAIMRSLQCIILQCGNQFVSSFARLAQDEFQPTYDAMRARKVTLGSLDEVPRFSSKVSENSRQTALLRVISSLQKLTSMDINELCNVDTTVSKPKPVSELSFEEFQLESEVAPPTEEEQRQAAASQVPPLAPSDSALA